LSDRDDETVDSFDGTCDPGQEIVGFFALNLREI
jgi:hypothetical protein